MEKKLSKATQPEIKLAGIDLGYDTETDNGKAKKDREALWQRFNDEGIAAKIKGKLSDEIILVSYRPRRPPVTQNPFRYYIGVPVGGGEELPKGIDTFTIPAGNYHKMSTIGDAVDQKWAEIEDSDLDRSYEPDYEVYSGNSLSSSAGQVDIFVS